jgi:hypothetical protein
MIEIRAQLEVKKQTRSARLWTRAFPNAGHTFTGKFANQDIRKAVGNIDGKLAP